WAIERIKPSAGSSLKHQLPLQVPLERALLGRVSQTEEIAEPVFQFTEPAADVDLAVSDRPDPKLLIADARRPIHRPHVAEDLEARLKFPFPGPERLPWVIEVDALLVVVGAEGMLEKQVYGMNRIAPLLL